MPGILVIPDARILHKLLVLAIGGEVAPIHKHHIKN